MTLEDYKSRWTESCKSVKKQQCSKLCNMGLRQNTMQSLPELITDKHVTEFWPVIRVQPSGQLSIPSRFSPFKLCLDIAWLHGPSFTWVRPFCATLYFYYTTFFSSLTIINAKYKSSNTCIYLFKSAHSTGLTDSSGIMTGNRGLSVKKWSSQWVPLGGGLIISQSPPVAGLMPLSSCLNFSRDPSLFLLCLLHS